MAMEGVAVCRVMRKIKSVTLYCIRVNGSSCGILGVLSGCISQVVAVGGTSQALILNDEGKKASSRLYAASRLYFNRYSTMNMA